MNLALGKISDKKSLSIQEEEVLMEQIRTYPCLNGKSKMSYKEGDVNRNVWGKVAEKLDFIQIVLYNVDIKNLLRISSGKKPKRYSKSFRHRNTSSEACVMF